MKTFVILVFAVGALVVASPALAGHCDAEIAAVDAAAASTTVGSNQIEAVAGLTSHGMDACDREQSDGAVLDPTIVTVGQAMLVNAAALLRGN